MGKSCFKFITCAGDSVDHEHIGVPQSKGSSGRRWSFRKSSLRHRVSSNTVISEAPSCANFQLQPNLSVSEKTSLTRCIEETTELSAQPVLEVSDNMAPAEDDSLGDASLDDSSIIILQAAIRRSLARRLLLKHKSVIKLQALVRGHIARKQAVETLRDVQAIVRNGETELADNSISNASAVQMGGSECGTELSISSTLDSPDRPEMEESKPAKESSILVSDPSYASSLLAIDSPQLQQKPEANPSGVPLKLEAEASPGRCRTIPESQATPASQVSVKPKKGESSQKSRSSSGDKTSIITLEQKERKNVKRCYSFGSARSYDHANQEPRDSSSSNSLPSYMRATESARAKATVSSSPRSSPDVHDKDIYIKKRLSLPGTDRRQGSPRIQRSLSQVQQKATHSLLERKWRR